VRQRVPGIEAHDAGKHGLVLKHDRQRRRKRHPRGVPQSSGHHDAQPSLVSEDLHE